jgi:hypothetical protein
MLTDRKVFHVVQDLGGMKILLRFAVDACTSPVKDADDDSLRPFLRRKGRKAPTRPRGKNSYVLPAQGVFITRTTPRKLVPQASLVEIKACASHRAVNWVELYPRLYLSQTAFLYIAKHHRGNFNPPEKVELGAENMLPHARHAEQGMVKLKVVLQNILDAVKKEDHRVGLSLVCKNGQLTLYRRQEGTGKALGCEITSKFK